MHPNLDIVNQDALQYALQASIRQNRYEYIIHDVFTGGAEPTPLFTNSFLKTLKCLLKPQGAIAIVRQWSPHLCASS